MPEFAKLEEIRRRQITNLKNSGLDDVNTPGSVTNLLVESFAEALADLSSDEQDSFNNGNVQTASGFYLDFKGEDYALRRASSAPALVLASDKNLKFYTNRGILRERLGDKIPANTIISTEDGGVSFIVNETNIPAGVTEVFVTAVSSNTNGDGNVGSGMLTQHSLQVSDVSVTNLQPVTNARITENDDFYRQRLLRHMRGTIATTPDEIISQVLGLPGVANADFRPNVFGINHPAILMSGPERLNPGVIRQAEAITAPFLPLGTRVRFLVPDYVSADIGLAVRRRANIGSEAALRSGIETTVRNTLRNLRPGGSFDFTRLDSELTRRHPDVLDVDIMDIKIDGRTHSNRKIQLDENEQLILDNLQIELI